MPSKMISVSVPETMLPEIDAVARKEHRSRSELVREALRRYLSGRDRMIATDEAKADEIEAARKGRAEFERGEFVRLEDLQRELGLPTR
jgi:metal-responsive CopG/Arc/MetJ family transcriptional regulator